jgi:23S rRNA pseudouridine1911/1915/1917 synthase
MGAGCRNFLVAAEQAGLALGPVLRLMAPGTPWSQVHRWIANRHVQVNGNLCVDRGRKLKAGDAIKLWDEPRPAPPREDQLRIRYLDRHVGVVEKPAGVTSTRHSEERDWSPRRKQRQPTLDEMLQRIIGRKQRASRGTRPDRIRAVHRLDRDTSGLMVFARSAQAEQRLVQMFRKHAVERAYLAICIGDVPAAVFDTRFVRDRGDGRRGSTTLPGVGKRAVTHVQPRERLGSYTLVECRLETGRTHQIRIHLAEAGHMVCGEKVYGKRFGGKPTPDASGAPRQALHAFRLALAHPISGQRLEFEMPLPSELQRLLARLRKG